MTIWAKAKLSIEFETESVHDKTMNLCILHNNQIVQESRAMPDGISTWTHDIELPTTITLITSGRTQSSTIVDEHNNIVKNMSINIKNIFLDGLPIWNFWTDHFVIAECDDSDDLVIGPVICANAKIDLYFDEASVFKWVVKTKLQ
jgi:hypothetical protein